MNKCSTVLKNQVQKADCVKIMHFNTNKIEKLGEKMKSEPYHLDSLQSENAFLSKT